MFREQLPLGSSSRAQCRAVRFARIRIFPLRRRVKPTGWNLDCSKPVRTLIVYGYIRLDNQPAHLILFLQKVGPQATADAVLLSLSSARPDFTSGPRAAFSCAAGEKRARNGLGIDRSFSMLLSVCSGPARPVGGAQWQSSRFPSPKFHSVFSSLRTLFTLARSQKSPKVHKISSFRTLSEKYRDGLPLPLQNHTTKDKHP